MKFKKLSIFLLISFYVMLIPPVVLAQAAASSSWITKVGNAKDEDRPQVGNGSLAQAAIDLFTAYQSCTNLDTTERYVAVAGAKSSYANKPCLINNLRSKYPGSIDAFSTRYGNGFGFGAIPGNCVECLGFVGLSLSLVTGDTQAMSSSSAGNYFNVPKIESNGKTFLPASAPPQPGDIGVTLADSNDASIGHILIVKSFDSRNSAKFVGLESSYPRHCFVNDSQPHNVEAYHFYRLKSI